MADPPVGQGMVRVVERGMDRQPCGLIQYGNKVVLIRDRQRDRLGRDACRRVRRQCECHPLPRTDRLIRVDGGAIRKKALPCMFYRFDQTGGQTTAAQEKAQTLALGFRRHKITKLHRRASFNFTPIRWYYSIKQRPMQTQCLPQTESGTPCRSRSAETVLRNDWTVSRVLYQTTIYLGLASPQGSRHHRDARGSASCPIRMLLQTGFT